MNKLSLALGATMLLGLCTFTSCSSGDASDFDYKVDETTNTVKLTKYHGKKAFVEVPSKIQGKPVTTLDYDCFDDAIRMEKLYIPSTVNEIKCTFYDAEYLSEVHIDSVDQWLDTKFNSESNNPLSKRNLYIGDKKINTLVIPEGTKAINDYAFCGANISEVKLPKSIETIGYRALNSTKLKKAHIEDLSAYCAVNVDTSFDFDLSLYMDNSRILDLVIPSDVKEIKPNVFYPFEFNSIKLNEGLETLGESCFNNNETMKGEFKLPSTLKTIGDYSLSAFYNVEKITIPESVNSIGHGAFFYDSKLKETNIPEGIKVLPGNIFGHCTSLESVSLPSTLETIEEHAFMNCGKLKCVTLGEKVTSIGYGAFDRCSSLTEIYIPASVTKISENAFMDCPNLVIKTPLSEIPEGWEDGFKEESAKIIFNCNK